MQRRYNLLKVPEPFCGLGAGGGVTGAGGGVDGLACWKKLNAGGAAFFFTSGFFSSTTGAGGGAGLALLVPKKSMVMEEREIVTYVRATRSQGRGKKIPPPGYPQREREKKSHITRLHTFTHETILTRTYQ